jgi:hypothetical protein
MASLPDIGGKERRYMTAKIKYTDEPIGKEAKKYNTQYQKMIRRLLDEYSAHQ